jgi:hypothetical protein
MYTHEQHVTFLLSWYNSAPEDVKDEGRRWYDNQRELIRELSRTHSLPVDTVAAVVAALSPMTRWPENIAGAIRMLRAFESGAAEPPRNCTLFYKNACKAWGILHGENAWELFTHSPKVRSFWRNLVGDEDAVTIDTWMARAVGEDKLAAQGLKPEPYNRIVAAVKDAAQQVAETPAEFQAIVWVQIRRRMAWFDTTKEAA